MPLFHVHGLMAGAAPWAELWSGRAGWWAGGQRRARRQKGGSQQVAPVDPARTPPPSASSPAPGLLAPLAAGAAVILPAAGRFAASTFWADAVEHGATFYTGGWGESGWGL